MGHSGFGTTAAFNSTTIAEVRDVSGPGMSREDINVSSGDSASDMMEFQPGMIDPGEITVTTLHDSDVDPLTFFSNDRVTAGLVITFPLEAGQSTAAKVTVDAYLKGWSAGNPYDGEATTDWTFKVSGLPVFAQAT